MLRDFNIKKYEQPSILGSIFLYSTQLGFYITLYSPSWTVAHCTLSALYLLLSEMYPPSTTAAAW
jgi:hypothetical protein